MRRNLWTFLSFTIHCLKHSLELFLAEFSMLNNKYLKFGGGRFGCTGIIWDLNIKQENGHGPLTFSALWHQTQSISLTLVDYSQDLHWSSSRRTYTERRRSCYPRPALGPWHETSPGPYTWMVPRETQCPCMNLGGRQSVYQSQELRSIFLNSELKHFSQ